MVAPICGNRRNLRITLLPVVAGETPALPVDNERARRPRSGKQGTYDMADPAKMQALPPTGLDVRQFGAKGDGKTDDTAAFVAALAAAAPQRGTVFVPDGIYRVGTIKLPTHTGLVGNASWGYREGGGSVLQLADPAAKCLIDITAAVGATVNGLSLDGGQLGTDVHGIYLGPFENKKEEDTPRIERCHISRFTGDGIRLDPVWCFSVRSCEVIFNKGNGLCIRGWDGFILDNWFSGNGAAGFGAYGPSASNTLTGNRIEWNAGGGIRICGGSHYNITGNYIDRAGCGGIVLLPRENSPCFCLTITGNVIYRSGRPEWVKEDFDSAHLRFEEVHGLVCTGNSLCAGQDDGGGKFSPRYGIILRALKNSIVKDNVLHIGALQELVRDLGGHGEGVIIKDNVGSLFQDVGKSLWASGQV